MFMIVTEVRNTVMAISDKTRKLLWGKSGNRCAYCQRRLTVDATSDDGDAIVGDECHIISASPRGPRYDPAFSTTKLDDYENLILLCKTHHKMIDDQPREFSAGALRKLKTKHEKWVNENLSKTAIPTPLRISRSPEKTPEYLFRVESGRQVLSIVGGASGYLLDHVELHDEEVAKVGTFLEMAKDYGELSDCLEIGDRVRIATSFTTLIHELADLGLWVFGGREIRILEGGIDPTPSDFPIGILFVVRDSDPTIVPIVADEMSNSVDK